MSDTRYLAIAFSSRTANGHLRTAVTAAAPADAKVVRTRSDVVAAVFEVDEDIDARSEGERLRRRVSKDAEDADLSVAVSGPKRGATGAHLWYTMPYVEGDTLRQRLVRQRTLPVDEAIRITCEVATALEESGLHSQQADLQCVCPVCFCISSKPAAAF